MDQVVILFRDGELLYARIPPLAFDLPVIEAQLQNVDSNSEEAVLPLAAIRQIIIGPSEPAPPREQLQSWDRAAFHFIDGQVLRAWIGPTSRLGAHGGVWTLVEPDGDEMRTVGIPYTSLKGVFRVRQWDSRAAGDRGPGRAANHLDNIVTALAERDARAGRGPALTGAVPDAGGEQPAAPAASVNVIGRRL